MSGRVPYEPKNCIVLRINYPGDENLAGNAFDYYGGCAPWFWIDNENVILGFPEGTKYFKSCKGYGRPINRGLIKTEYTTSKHLANETIQITHKVWELYIKFLGVKLKEVNKQYFEKGIQFQNEAIHYLQKSNIDQYIKNMNLAYKEYKEIM